MKKNYTTKSDALKLIHELEVHKIELEMQNEELALAKEQTKVTKEKYFELYDLAPSGYLNLSKEGKIIESNLFGASLLGKERQHLIGSRFDSFISDDTKPIFKLFLSRIFTGKDREMCEVVLSTEHKLICCFLTGIVTKNGEQCILNINDVSNSRQAPELKRSESNLKERIKNYLV